MKRRRDAWCGPRSMRRVSAAAVAFLTFTLSMVALSPSSSAAATPVFRQQASVLPTAGQSVQVAYPSAELAADTNVVVVGWNDATSIVTSVVDSAGNHYQVAAAPV